MLTWIREKFGRAVISVIIGLIAFVFVFFGVISPKSTRGIHEGAVAGTVNGEVISRSEFSQELNRRLEFFKNIGGGKFTDEQLKAFRVRESVYDELVRRRVMQQQAKKAGLVGSDEQVRDEVRQIPAFQKGGKFDLATYKEVLEANQMTAGGFERSIREGISAQKWDGYFKSRVFVSDEEVRDEYLTANEKRNLKFVLLRPESPDKLKELEKVADQIVGLMTASKAGDASVNSLVKKAGKFEIKQSGLFSLQGRVIPGIGDAPEAVKDAFANPSPIDGSRGGKAKKYFVAGSILVGLVTESKSPQLSELTKDAKAWSTLATQIASRKERALYESWMKKAMAQSTVETNAAVVSGAEATD